MACRSGSRAAQVAVPREYASTTTEARAMKTNSRYTNTSNPQKSHGRSADAEARA